MLKKCSFTINLELLLVILGVAWYSITQMDHNICFHLY